MTLGESVATKQGTGDFHDESRGRLSTIFLKRIKQKGSTTKVVDAHGSPTEGAPANVVDFVALLKKILGEKGGETKKAHSKTAVRKSPDKQATKGRFRTSA